MISREPDFKFDWFHFYIEQMMQYNEGQGNWYEIRVDEEGYLLYLSLGKEEWMHYSEHSNTIRDLYYGFLAEKILLGEI